MAVLGQEDRSARRRRADTGDRALARPCARELNIEPDDDVDGLAADAACRSGYDTRSVIAARWNESPAPIGRSTRGLAQALLALQAQSPGSHARWRLEVP